MRIGAAFAIALSMVLAIGGAGSASAQSYTFCPFQSPPSATDCGSRLLFDLHGSTAPRELPKREMVPISLEFGGSVSNENGSHPPMLREALVDFDKNGEIDARGLPTCSGRQLRTRSTKEARKRCLESIIGSGMAHIGTGTPASEPIPSSLTLFNGGVRDGVTTLFIHGQIAVPNPVPIVTAVKITKQERGRYGVHTVSKLPQILEGNGSILDFNFKIERRFSYRGERHSYLMARCFDGRLQASFAKATFREEPRPGAVTVISGTLIHPCTPVSSTDPEQGR